MKKRFIKYLAMPGLTLWQRLYVWYFILSFLLILGIEEDVTPVWEMLLAGANFANAARLVNKVPLHDEPDD